MLLATLLDSGLALKKEIDLARALETRMVEVRVVVLGVPCQYILDTILLLLEYRQRQRH
jgi:hypothetical protein